MTNRRVLPHRAASVLLITASLVASLLLVEGGLRLATHLSSVNHYLFPVMVGFKQADYSALFEYDEALSKDVLRPLRGYRHVHDGGEYDYDITTVECAGFFIRPPCHTGPDSVFHFGDSFAFGFGLPVDETFVALLDQTGPLRHVNFGIPGDNLLAELDEARVVIERLPPGEPPQALYFHAFLGNDFRGSWQYLERRGELPEAASRRRSWLAQQIKDSELRKLVKNRLNALRFEWKGDSRVTDGVNFFPKNYTEIERMDSNALEVVDTVARASAKRAQQLRALYPGAVVVTLIPPKEIFLLREDPKPYQRRRDALVAALEPHGVIILDMLEAVAPGELLPLYFPIDTHFDREGHAWFARFLRTRPPLSQVAAAADP